MPEWKRTYEGVENMKLAVMGCIVNGPGESKAANIGISLPGTGEAPRCPVYIDGQKFTTLEGTYDELSAAFQTLRERLRLHQISQARNPGLCRSAQAPPGVSLFIGAPPCFVACRYDSLALDFPQRSLGWSPKLSHALFAPSALL